MSRLLRNVRLIAIVCLVVGSLWVLLRLTGCSLPGTASDLELTGTPNAPVFELADPRLAEISGLAASLRVPRRFWVHNDSGNAPVLHALEATEHGITVVGRVSVLKAPRGDWEDLAAFEYGGEPWLLIGDIGDNASMRSNVKLLAIREPALESPDAALKLSVPIVHRLRLTYPGGSRDAEGLAVDRDRGEILLLSKREQEPQLYHLPLAALFADKTVVAERTAKLSTLPRPTAFDRQADPRRGGNRSWPTALDLRQGRLLVVTYKDAYAWQRQGNETWQDALLRLPTVIDLPQLEQTEAGVWIDDGSSVLIASERMPARFALVPVPATITP